MFSVVISHNENWFWTLFWDAGIHQWCCSPPALLQSSAETIGCVLSTPPAAEPATDTEGHANHNHDCIVVTEWGETTKTDSCSPPAERS